MLYNYTSMLCYHVSTHPVGERDLKSLHSELYPLSVKWYPLGIQLQVSIGTLKSIQKENISMADCLLHGNADCLVEVYRPSSDLDCSR